MVGSELRRLIESRGAPAQLHVIQHGQVVLDECFHCEPTSLFYLFSASKPYVAMAIHLLAQRGALGLDDPVAKHWPEFGQRGKESITVRHVLQHRSGVALAHSVVGDGLAMTDWHRSIRLIERATPSGPPGGPPRYHLLSFGFILGEVVARVSGVPLRTFLTTEILSPLGLDDTHLGVERVDLARTLPIMAVGRLGPLARAVFNRRSVRTGVIPAAGISTTATQLARFYQALLIPRLFTEATMAQARQPSTEGLYGIRWAQGFQLGGPLRDGRPARAMGSRSSPLTFGHNGSMCCIGWADPTRGLAVAYVTSLLDPVAGRAHMTAVADAILQLGPLEPAAA